MGSGTAFPARFNFARHLMDINRDRPHKDAYLDDAGAVTYGMLDDGVRRVASALLDLGLHREERVLVCLHDTIDFPLVFLGALYAGVVPVCVNTLLTVDDYAFMLEHSRAQALVVSGALVPTLVQAMERAAHEVRSIVVSRPGAGLAQAMHEFTAWRERAASLTAPAPTSPDSIAFWLYSSGSTGRPKGTVHTHDNLLRTEETYGRGVLDLRESDVTFSAAKLFFAYGLGNALTFPLSVGATVVLMAERPTPAAVFERLVKRRPTVFFGVPTLYAAMLASADLPTRADVCLRRCVSAGEPLPKDIGERFAARFGCDVLDGIGSTEMLHIFLSNRPGEVRYGTTGTPVPGYDLELRGEDGRQAADGEIGDLFIRGPSAALMYWENAQKSRSTFEGAWTRSGDKYVRSADGCYTYAGRSDDMLKVGGQFVSPFEVEAALMRHEAVLEAAVVGKDCGGLTRTLAYVVLKSGTGDDALADSLKAFVKGQLAPHKYPREIRFIAELPKTATGKIQRFKLREAASR